MSRYWQVRWTGQSSCARLMSAACPLSSRDVSRRRPLRSSCAQLRRPASQARGMAKLGGLNFRAIGNNHHWLRVRKSAEGFCFYFLSLLCSVAPDVARRDASHSACPPATPFPQYLPKRVSAPPRNDTNCTTFERACAMCYDWRYSHKCLGAWTELGPEIIRDTRAALEEWARENGREVPQFTKDDVVVQNRCSAEVWLNHPVRPTATTSTPSIRAARHNALRPAAAEGPGPPLIPPPRRRPPGVRPRGLQPLRGDPALRQEHLHRRRPGPGGLRPALRGEARGAPPRAPGGAARRQGGDGLGGCVYDVQPHGVRADVLQGEAVAMRMRRER